jgi:hypothetical protein
MASKWSSRLPRITPIEVELGFARYEATLAWTAAGWPRDCATSRTPRRPGGSGVPVIRENRMRTGIVSILAHRKFDRPFHIAESHPRVSDNGSYANLAAAGPYARSKALATLQVIP